MKQKMKSVVMIMSLMILPVVFSAGCGFLYPPEIRYSSYGVPQISSEDPNYTYNEEENTVEYDLGGSSIVVKFMTDAELNELFPNESSAGYYSTNPYTYGNWVDPDIGYTPKRFSVFQVSIINRSFPKMFIDPVEAQLITDLGETYNSYTTSVAAARHGNSFETYYKSIRGTSGNEYYRYEMRIGMVRGRNFGLEETVFNGDSYTGLITFDTLRPEVKHFRLVLNDVVFRFDAFNRPSNTQTINFDFERKIDSIIVTREMKLKELEREKVEIQLAGPSQLINNRANDSARNDRTIDRILAENVEAMSQCFMERYRQSEVTPGSMSVSFTIESNGTISNQNITEVRGIQNESFMNCVLDVFKGMQFAPIEDMPAEGENIVKGPALPVNVLYPLEFVIVVNE